MNIQAKNRCPVSSRCFSEEKITAAPSDAGLRAFQCLRRQAKENGLQDMSLDEINEVITKSRAGKRKEPHVEG